MSVYEIGMEVICPTYGRGIVIDVIVTEAVIYPVRVKFEDHDDQLYTSDGRWGWGREGVLEIVDEEKFVNFKIGDEVYCIDNGVGVVDGFDFDLCHPVKVSFECGEYDTYTFKGEMYHGEGDIYLSKVKKGEEEIIQTGITSVNEGGGFYEVSVGGKVIKVPTGVVVNKVEVVGEAFIITFDKSE